MFNLTLKNVVKGFTKTINDLDKLIVSKEMDEESAMGRITKASEDLKEATAEIGTAKRIKENLEKLIEGV